MLEQSAAAYRPEDRLCRALQCRKIIADQCADRPNAISRARRTRQGAPANSISSMIGGRLDPRRHAGLWLCQGRKARLCGQWQALLRAICAGGRRLQRVFVLIDARHGVKRPTKRSSSCWTRRRSPTRSVLTKADKMKPAELDPIDGRNGGAPPPRRTGGAIPRSHATSSVKGDRVAGARAEIAAL